MSQPLLIRKRRVKKKPLTADSLSDRMLEAISARHKASFIANKSVQFFYQYYRHFLAGIASSASHNSS